jgi:hypothetical protein
VSSSDRGSEQRLLGLSPRPEPDPEIVAALVAAAEELLRPRRVAPAQERPSLAWKYSGRWFVGHQVRLRGRPF